MVKEAPGDSKTNCDGDASDVRHIQHTLLNGSTYRYDSEKKGEDIQKIIHKAARIIGRMREELRVCPDSRRSDGSPTARSVAQRWDPFPNRDDELKGGGPELKT